MFIWITEGLPSLWIVCWTDHLLSNEQFSWRKCLQNASTRKTRSCGTMLTPMLVHCLQNRLQLTSWWKLKLHAQDSLSLPESAPPVFFIFVFLLFLPFCFLILFFFWSGALDLCPDHWLALDGWCTLNCISRQHKSTLNKRPRWAEVSLLQEIFL